jgi:anti-anti-sigma regulatory factor
MVVRIDLVVATLRDAKPFWNELEENLVFDREKVIIDLSSCTYIDSTFTGMIIRTQKTIKRNNNRLRVVFPHKIGVINFWAIGLTKVIKCFDTLQEATESFELKKVNWRAKLNEEFLRN